MSLPRVSSTRSSVTFRPGHIPPHPQPRTPVPQHLSSARLCAWDLLCCCLWQGKETAHPPERAGLSFSHNNHTFAFIRFAVLLVSVICTQLDARTHSFSVSPPYCDSARPVLWQHNQSRTRHLEHSQRRITAATAQTSRSSITLSIFLTSLRYTLSTSTCSANRLSCSLRRLR